MARSIGMAADATVFRAVITKKLRDGTTVTEYEGPYGSIGAAVHGSRSGSTTWRSSTRRPSSPPGRAGRPATSSRAPSVGGAHELPKVRRAGPAERRVLQGLRPTHRPVTSSPAGPNPAGRQPQGEHDAGTAQHPHPRRGQRDRPQHGRPPLPQPDHRLLRPLRHRSDRRVHGQHRDEPPGAAGRRPEAPRRERGLGAHRRRRRLLPRARWERRVKGYYPSAWLAYGIQIPDTDADQLEDALGQLDDQHGDKDDHVGYLHAGRYDAEDTFLVTACTEASIGKPVAVTPNRTDGDRYADWDHNLAAAVRALGLTDVPEPSWLLIAAVG